MSSYDQLSDDHLAHLFVEFRKCIQKGTLSHAMYNEVYLIRLAAEKRGISKTDLLKIYLEATTRSGC